MTSANPLTNGRTRTTRVLVGLAAHLLLGCILVGCESESPPPVPATAAPPAGEPEPGAKPPVTECGTKVPAPRCSALTAAPRDPAKVSSFVTESAIPLRCDVAGSDAAWNVQPLVELFADNKVFMMGEVHGQNEIGIVSAVVFETLAAKNLVNVLALEVPMDLEPDFQRYVDTGRDLTVAKVASQVPNMFVVTLLKAARALKQKGISVRVVGVDIPEDPQFAAREIKAIAAKLTTQRAAVLDTLPSTFGTPSSIADIDAYFDAVTAKKDSICSELSPADCDRLIAMTNALWCSVHGRSRKDDLRYGRREEAIYSNIKTAITSDARMYLHMGSEHTTKRGTVAPGRAGAGARLSNENEATRGKVIAIGPAWSPGSTVFYAGAETEASATDFSVTTAFPAPPAQPMFVSTLAPSARCEANPIGAEVTEDGPRGEVFDGYIHYGKLTPENRPGDTVLKVRGR